MKLISKSIFVAIFSLTGSIVMYAMCAVIGSFIVVNRSSAIPEKGIEIFIISNGVHTDIGIPVMDAEIKWNDVIGFSSFESKFNATGYISFGWGDKGFYLDTPNWSDLKLTTALTAAFLPSPTAMHVSLLDTKPVKGELIKSVLISKEQFRNLETYIYGHFVIEGKKARLINCCRYGSNDNFYEARGSYSLLRTCNNWANQALKRAGIKTALWAPFDKCILYQFN